MARKWRVVGRRSELDGRYQPCPPLSLPMTGSYSFPLLANNEIVACMGELGCDLREAELLRPTFDILRPLYENLVMLLVGLTREEMQQPALQAIDCFEYPEMHDDSVGTLAFSKALISLMKGSGVHDFSLKDLHKPEYNRTRRSLSAVINFAKFREEKLVIFTELQERSDGLSERKQQLLEKNAKLRAILKKHDEQAAAEEEHVNQLNTEAAELSGTLACLNEEQALLIAETSRVKSTGAELHEKMTKLKARIADLENEGERLKGEVVQSPEKMQSALEQLEASLVAETSAASEAESRHRQLHSRLEYMSKIEKDLTKCLSLMEDADGAIKKKKEVSHAIKGLKAKMQENEEATWSLTAEHQHLERQQQLADARLKRLTEQAGLKRETSSATLKNAMEEKENLDRERKLNDGRIAEGKQRVQKTRKAMNENTKKHEMAMDYMMEKYNTLLVQVQKYHNEMAAIMDE